MGIIEINGTAKREVNYDIAVITVEFTARDKNSYDASKTAMKNCETFLSEVEKLGINSSAFSLNEDRVSENYYSDNYYSNATRGIQLKLSFDMELVNTIRSLLDESKCDAHFNIDYELSNESEIEAELLKEALLDSKKKAESLAEALGQKVKGIESINSYSDDGVMFKEHERGIANYRCAPMMAYGKSNELKSKAETLSQSIQVKWIVED